MSILRTRTATIALAVASLTVLGACGSDDDPGDDVTTTTVAGSEVDDEMESDDMDSDDMGDEMAPESDVEGEG